jgi:hypothetical protein
MSKVRADNISNRADDGAPALTYGAEIPVGIAITGAGNINVGGAATISGNINVGGAATISGDITVRNITGVAATISGNLSVGGTLTYEDVTNIDSVGVITARSGIRVGAGESIGSDGAAVVYYGDGSNLDGVVSGIELEQAGSSVGTSVTAINFASGATLTSVSSGISTVTIAAGLNTTAATVSGIVTFLSLDDAQDHKLTISGISTISCTGGSEGDSHIVRIVNSGITTVGFSTFFLFPSGSTPSLPTADGAISLISFTVHRVGAAGTQLLAGASVNYS